MARSEPGGLGPVGVLSITGGIVLADAFTKLLAVDRLAPIHTPHPVLGDVLRWTLVYNPGAAFGLHLGPWSRWIFIVLTFVALGVLWSMYRQSVPEARLKVIALATIAGGAIGNLVDRVRSSRGVVDFIDVGVGDWRWPTFNIADIAVSCGAIALAIVLWREDVEAERLAKAEASADATDEATAAPDAHGAS
ncbi:signal peptidase II [Pseudogemmatithrix spongiicola]|uniref:Lipoprotein signal peptidase n=1 Tax=Pseudogemmatithrix spongiicola TaxID=3062599 RepID=A0AA49K257_9BACT|nr:signal peptidase II [Gemmatimonadaceae bacterium 'strain 138']WKW16570.1 signal peptidase II [Gemmatimonadaceae bacterium 'strain 318']